MDYCRSLGTIHLGKGMCWNYKENHNKVLFLGILIEKERSRTVNMKCCNNNNFLIDKESHSKPKKVHLLLYMGNYMKVNKLHPHKCNTLIGFKWK